ncbi:hypothetical protein [Fulvivirga sedimenti]|uniref:Uncharacterized protein n=1 Tax=Fulvivirga sedimenti TaxID=2879465 RepID=A0A9X1L143_9BACT|nr:hypothetical protein [Fulvivirga sedimenti]MCA6078544.1 hypothetical protein [Fulvivirga sedimenti]
MQTKRWLFYVLGGLVVGIFYAWFNDYNNPTVLGIKVKTILMTASSILAFLLCYFERGKAVIIALQISAGVALAVILRIIWDLTFVDETMHNLAPFEIGLAFGLSFITSLIGGLVGSFVRPKNTNA